MVDVGGQVATPTGARVRSFTVAPSVSRSVAGAVVAFGACALFGYYGVVSLDHLVRTPGFSVPTWSPVAAALVGTAWLVATEELVRRTLRRWRREPAPRRHWKTHLRRPPLYLFAALVVPLFYSTSTMTKSRYSSQSVPTPVAAQVVGKSGLIGLAVLCFVAGVLTVVGLALRKPAVAIDGTTTAATLDPAAIVPTGGPLTRTQQIVEEWGPTGHRPRTPHPIVEE